MTSRRSSGKVSFMWPWLPQGATWLGTGDVHVLTGQKVSRFEAPLYPMMLPPGTWGWYPMTDLSAPTGVPQEPALGTGRACWQETRISCISSVGTAGMWSCTQSCLSSWGHPLGRTRMSHCSVNHMLFPRNMQLPKINDGVNCVSS